MLQIGGLARRAGAIESVRRDHPELLLLDSGNLFAEEDGGDKAAAILDSYALMGYDAVALGNYDLLRGELSPTELAGALPFLAANLEPEAEGLGGLPGSVVFERRGLRVGVVAVINENIAGLAELAAGLGYRLRPWREALDEELDYLSGLGCELIILLSHLGTTAEVEAAREYQGRVDLIVGGHSGLFRQDVEPDFGVPLLWPGRTGRYLGLARIGLEPERRGELLSYDSIILDRTWPRSPEVVERLQRYEAGRYEHWLTHRYTSVDESPFSSPSQCGVCHGEEYEHWQGTGHARSHESLVARGDERNLDCLSCHTTGFDTPGGFGSVELTPHLASVGCQACHETTPLHPFDDHRVPELTAADCLACHRPDRVEDFDFERDLGRIIHR